MKAISILALLLVSLVSSVRIRTTSPPAMPSIADSYNLNARLKINPRITQTATVRDVDIDNSANLFSVNAGNTNAVGASNSNNSPTGIFV